MTETRLTENATEIVAYYSKMSRWDLYYIIEDLGIEIEDITDYYVRWDTLHLTYKKDGIEQEAEYEPQQAYDDYLKYPDSTEVLE